MGVYIYFLSGSTISMKNQDEDRIKVNFIKYGYKAGIFGDSPHAKRMETRYENYWDTHEYPEYAVNMDDDTMKPYIGTPVYKFRSKDVRYRFYDDIPKDLVEVIGYAVPDGKRWKIVDTIEEAREITDEYQ